MSHVEKTIFECILDEAILQGFQNMEKNIDEYYFVNPHEHCTLIYDIFCIYTDGLINGVCHNNFGSILKFELL